MLISLLIIKPFGFIFVENTLMAKKRLTMNEITEKLKLFTM